MSYARYSLQLLCLLFVADCMVQTSERWKKREINQIVEIDIQSEGDKEFQRKLDIGGKEKLFVNKNSPKISPLDVSSLEMKQHSIFERKDKPGNGNRFVLSPKETDIQKNITRDKTPYNKTKPLDKTSKSLKVDRTIFKFVNKGPINNRGPLNVINMKNTKPLKPQIQSKNINFANHIVMNKSSNAIKLPIKLNSKLNLTKISTKLKKLENLLENVKKLNQSHMNVKHIAGLLKNLLNKTNIGNPIQHQFNILKNNLKKTTANSSILLHPAKNLTALQKVFKNNVKPLKIIPKVISVTDNNNNNIKKINLENKKYKTNTSSHQLVNVNKKLPIHKLNQSNIITQVEPHSAKRTPQELIEAIQNNQTVGNHSIVLNSSVPVHTETSHEDQKNTDHELTPEHSSNNTVSTTEHVAIPAENKTIENSDQHPIVPTAGENSDSNLQNSSQNAVESQTTANSDNSQSEKTSTENSNQSNEQNNQSNENNSQSNVQINESNSHNQSTIEQNQHSNQQLEHSNQQLEHSNQQLEHLNEHLEHSNEQLEHANEHSISNTTTNTFTNEGSLMTNSSNINLSPETHANEEVHTEENNAAPTNQTIAILDSSRAAPDIISSNSPIISGEQNMNSANANNTFSGPANQTVNHEELSLNGNQSEVNTSETNSNDQTTNPNNQSNQSNQQTQVDSNPPDLNEELKQLSNSLNMSEDNTAHDNHPATLTVLSTPVTIENASQLENGNKLIILENGHDASGTFHVLNITDYKVPPLESVAKAEPSVTVANVNMNSENFTEIIDNLNNTEANTGNQKTEEINTNITNTESPKPPSETALLQTPANNGTSESNVTDTLTFKTNQPETLNMSSSSLNETSANQVGNQVANQVGNLNTSVSSMNVSDAQLLINAVSNIEPNNSSPTSLNETQSIGNNSDIAFTNPENINETKIYNGSSVSISSNNTNDTGNSTSKLKVSQNHVTKNNNTMKFKKLSSKNRTLISTEKLKLKAKLAVETALKEFLKVDDSLANSNQIVLKPSKEIQVTLSKLDPNNKIKANATIKESKFKNDIKKKENRINEKSKNETEHRFAKMKEKAKVKLEENKANNMDQQNDIGHKADNETSTNNANLKEKSIEIDKLDKNATANQNEEGLAPAPINHPLADESKPEKPVKMKHKSKKESKCTKDCNSVANQDTAKATEKANSLDVLTNCHCCHCKNNSKEVIELGNPTPTSKALFELEDKLSSERQLAFPTVKPTTRPTVVNYKKLLEPQCKNGICDVEGFCKDKKTGTYPNHNDCRKYWICVGGRTYPATCPEGLVFNYKIFQCDDRIDIPMVLEEWYWATCNTKKSGIIKYRKKTSRIGKPKTRLYKG